MKYDVLPNVPNVAPGAVEEILSFIQEQRLKQNEIHVLEFGMGESTIFFSALANSVETFEHDPQWALDIQARLAKSNCSVFIHFHPSETILGTDYLVKPYAPYINSLQDEWYNIIFIDGRDRVACFDNCLSKVRTPAILILDDSQRPQYEKIHKDLLGFTY